jgi:hypothetical protein
MSTIVFKGAASCCASTELVCDLEPAGLSHAAPLVAFCDPVFSAANAPVNADTEIKKPEKKKPKKPTSSKKKSKFEVFNNSSFKKQSNGQFAFATPPAPTTKKSTTLLPWRLNRRLKETKAQLDQFVKEISATCDEKGLEYDTKQAQTWYTSHSALTWIGEKALDFTGFEELVVRTWEIFRCSPLNECSAYFLEGAELHNFVLWANSQLQTRTLVQWPDQCGFLEIETFPHKDEDRDCSRYIMVLGTRVVSINCCTRQVVVVSPLEKWETCENTPLLEFCRLIFNGISDDGFSQCSVLPEALKATLLIHWPWKKNLRPADSKLTLCKGKSGCTAIQDFAKRVLRLLH